MNSVLTIAETVPLVAAQSVHIKIFKRSIFERKFIQRNGFA